MEKVQIVREGGAALPRKGTVRSAGYDLQALIDGADEVVLQPGEYRRFSAGIRLALPAGTVGLVRPRSSTWERGLAIEGVWDEDFTGVFKLAVRNVGTAPATIQRGERLAQLLVMRRIEVEFEEVEQLEPTARGEGGFGHTGRHYEEASCPS